MGLILDLVHFQRNVIEFSNGSEKAAPKDLVKWEVLCCARHAKERLWAFEKAAGKRIIEVAVRPLGQK